MSIDWTKPELYTHCSRTDDEIANVHIVPPEFNEEHCVYVRWKSGHTCSYTTEGTINGQQFIIPKPRKPRVVEGWTKECFSRNGGWSFVVHQGEKTDESWVKVRVEEVIDETP